MQLEDLYNDFITARRKFAGSDPIHTGSESDLSQPLNWCRTPEHASYFYEHTILNGHYNPKSPAVRARILIGKAATLYLIARDDSIDAAVIWKLSNT